MMDRPESKCTVCGEVADHRVIGHREVHGTVCRKHIPRDYTDFSVFALND